MRTVDKTRDSTSITYVERVNLAIDHVVTHLGQPLRLADVSRAAMLSPFHFHRVFQSMVGVTLTEFVKRARLDRALSLMAFSPARRRGQGSLTTVALASGFSSPSDFSRCFKQRFGVPPSRFDVKQWRDAHAAELAALVAEATGRDTRRLHLDRLSLARNPDRFKVKLRELPARSVAYIRVRNPYGGDGVVRAVHRLIAWAQRHGLADGQWLGYQWENPEITRLAECQYQVAVEAEHFTPRGEVGCFKFPRMTVAQIEIRGGLDLELRALQWLYGTWLPSSSYVPDDHPAFEAWIGRPFAHGMEHFEIYVQVPVRRG